MITSNVLSALEYGKEIVALVVFNQHLFLSRKTFWFRCTCDELGWELSAAFCDHLYAILFMICADPDEVSPLSDSIKGTWGSSGPQKTVKKAFKEVAIKAEKEKKIKYKGAFNLLKMIFPTFLK